MFLNTLKGGSFIKFITYKLYKLCISNLLDTIDLALS